MRAAQSRRTAVRSAQRFQRRRARRERPTRRRPRHRDRPSRDATCAGRCGAASATASRGRSRARARDRRCRASAAARAARRVRALRSPRMRARRRAEPQQRMLEQRQQRHRLEPAQRRFGDEPREHAGRRVGQRIAAGIVDLARPSARARPHAARQRAVGRHQRGGLVLGLHRLAQRDRDGQRLFLGVGGLDHGRRCRARASRRRNRCLASARARDRWSRPAATLPTPAPRGLRRPCQRSTRLARHADAFAAAPAWRIADGRSGQAVLLIVLVAAISPQDASSRSVSRPGSTTAPCGSLAMVASSSRSPASSRWSRRRSPGRVPRLQAAAPRPRSAGRAARPARCSRSLRGAPASASRAIFRKPSVSCQYLSSWSGTSLSSLSHGTCRVVMSSISRARSSASASAAAGVLATSGAPRRGAIARSAHVRISSREQQPALQRRRARAASVERRLGELAGRGFGEDDLVLVDIAERRRCAAGSPRRRRARRERRRARAGRRAASADKASPSRAPADRRWPGSPDQPAVQQRGDQRRQERRRRRNGEDARATRRSLRHEHAIHAVARCQSRRSP